MTKSAPNMLGPEVRAKRRHTPIRVSIDWGQTAPLPQPNMTCTHCGRRCSPGAGLLCRAANDDRVNNPSRTRNREFGRRFRIPDLFWALTLNPAPCRLENHWKNREVRQIRHHMVLYMNQKTTVQTPIEPFAGWVYPSAPQVRRPARRVIRSEAGNNLFGKRPAPGYLIYSRRAVGY